MTEVKCAGQLTDTRFNIIFRSLPLVCMLLTQKILNIFSTKCLLFDFPKSIFCSVADACRLDLFK